MTEPIRVLLVDDQQLVRTGFSMILSTEDDIEVVGEAANGIDAISRARELRPDVTLMDVQMPMMDGIEATRSFVAEGLGQVVILTTFDRDDYLFDALRCGAAGFLLKNADPETLIEGVRVAARGQGLLSPEVTVRVIAELVRHDDHGVDVSDRGMGAVSRGGDGPRVSRSWELTDRETEVLTLMAEGLSNGEIATRLFIGESTVKTHVSNLLAKLGLRDRVQAVAFAYREGIVGLD